MVRLSAMRMSTLPENRHSMDEKLSPVAEEALDVVVPDNPALGGMGVHTSGITVRDLLAAFIGELDGGAGDEPVVGEVGLLLAGVDFDGLLPGVDDMDAVDGRVRSIGRGRGYHVDGVGVGKWRSFIPRRIELLIMKFFGVQAIHTHRC